MKIKTTQNKGRFIRIIAGAVVIMFATTSVAFPAPVTPSAGLETARIEVPAPSAVSVPDELGSVQTQKIGPNAGRVIVLIQDAHAVTDAQENIRKLLEHFQRNYAAGTFFVEGAKGALDPTLFRAYPDDKIKKQVLAGYFSAAELSGSEMASVLNEREGNFSGLEDWDLYSANYLAFQRAQAAKSGVRAKLEAIRSDLDRQKEKLFSEKLNEFLQAWGDFRAERTSLLDLLLYLSNFGELVKGKPEYLELAKLIDTVGYEKSGKQEALEPIVKQMGEEFKKKFGRKMDVRDQTNFFNTYQSFLTGKLSAGEMLLYMVRAGAKMGFRPKLTPQMRRLLGHAQVLAELRGSRLFDELQRFLPEAAVSLVRNRDEKELLLKYEKMFLLEDLADLELTHDQLSELMQRGDSSLGTRPSQGIATIPEELVPSPEARALFAPALEFYDYALRRDRTFYDQIRKAPADAKTVVMIAGGFHTSGLERILNEQGESYVVVTPKISSLAGQANYFKVMAGELSYKDYLQTTYYDALMRHAIRKLTENLKEPEFRGVLKLWRDNVIRDLAEKRRITDLGRYTRYFDELVLVYQERFGNTEKPRSRSEILDLIRRELEKFRDDTLASIWSRFEGELKTFTRGLQGLIDKKQLDTERVTGLLNDINRSAPMMVATPAALSQATVPGVVVTPGLEDLVRTVVAPTRQIREALGPVTASPAETVAANVARGLVNQGAGFEKAAPEVKAVDMAPVQAAVNAVARQTFPGEPLEIAKAKLAGAIDQITPEIPGPAANPTPDVGLVEKRAETPQRPGLDVGEQAEQDRETPTARAETRAKSLEPSVKKLGDADVIASILWTPAEMDRVWKKWEGAKSLDAQEKFGEQLREKVKGPAEQVVRQLLRPGTYQQGYMAGSGLTEALTGAWAESLKNSMDSYFQFLETRPGTQIPLTVQFLIRPNLDSGAVELVLLSNGVSKREANNTDEKIKAKLRGLRRFGGADRGWSEVMTTPFKWFAKNSDFMSLEDYQDWIRDVGGPSSDTQGAAVIFRFKLSDLKDIGVEPKEQYCARGRSESRVGGLDLSQQVIRERGARLMPDESFFSKKGLLAFEIPIPDPNNLPGEIKRLLGKQDQTYRDIEQVLKDNAGGMIGLQMNGNSPDFYVISPRVAQTKYQKTPVGYPGYDKIVKAMKAGVVKMVKVSALAEEGEDLINQEVRITVNWGGATDEMQTKPAGQDAYLAYDGKQWYMINVDADKLPINYGPVSASGESRDTTELMTKGLIDVIVRRSLLGEQGRENLRKKLQMIAELARTAHSGQRRKNGDLYFTHPLKVAWYLMTRFKVYSPLAFCFALLHDTREDQAEFYGAIKGIMDDIFRELEQRALATEQELAGAADKKREELANDLREYNLMRLAVRLLTKIEPVLNPATGRWEITHKGEDGNDVTRDFVSEEEAEAEAEKQYYRQLLNPHRYFRKHRLQPGEPRYSDYDDAFIRSVQQAKLCDRIMNIRDLINLYNPSVEQTENIRRFPSKMIGKTLDRMIPYFVEGNDDGAMITAEDRQMFYEGFVGALIDYAELDTGLDPRMQPLKDTAVNALRDARLREGIRLAGLSDRVADVLIRAETPQSPDLDGERPGLEVGETAGQDAVRSESRILPAARIEPRDAGREASEVQEMGALFDASFDDAMVLLKGLQGGAWLTDAGKAYDGVGEKIRRFDSLETAVRELFVKLKADNGAETASSVRIQPRIQKLIEDIRLVLSGLSRIQSELKHFQAGMEAANGEGPPDTSLDLFSDPQESVKVIDRAIEEMGRKVVEETGYRGVRSESRTNFRKRLNQLFQTGVFRVFLGLSVAGFVGAGCEPFEAGQDQEERAGENVRFEILPGASENDIVSVRAWLGIAARFMSNRGFTPAWPETIYLGSNGRGDYAEGNDWYLSTISSEVTVSKLIQLTITSAYPNLGYVGTEAFSRYFMVLLSRQQGWASPLPAGPLTYSAALENLRGEDISGSYADYSAGRIGRDELNRRIQTVSNNPTAIAQALSELLPQLDAGADIVALEQLKSVSEPQGPAILEALLSAVMADQQNLVRGVFGKYGITTSTRSETRSESRVEVKELEDIGAVKIEPSSLDDAVPVVAGRLAAQVKTDREVSGGRQGFSEVLISMIPGAKPVLFTAPRHPNEKHPIGITHEDILFAAGFPEAMKKSIVRASLDFDDKGMLEEIFMIPSTKDLVVSPDGAVDAGSKLPELEQLSAFLYDVFRRVGYTAEDLDKVKISLDGSIESLFGEGDVTLSRLAFGPQFLSETMPGARSELRVGPRAGAVIAAVMLGLVFVPTLFGAQTVSRSFDRSTIPHAALTSSLGIGCSAVQNVIRTRQLAPGTKAAQDIIFTYYHETYRLVENAKKELGDQEFKRLFRLSKNEITPERIIQLGDFMFNLNNHESIGHVHSRNAKSTALSPAQILKGTRSMLFKNPLFKRLTGVRSAAPSTERQWEEFLVTGADANLRRIAMVIIHLDMFADLKGGEGLSFDELFSGNPALQARHWGKFYHTQSPAKGMSDFRLRAETFAADARIASRDILKYMTAAPRTSSPGAIAVSQRPVFQIPEEDAFTSEERRRAEEAYEKEMAKILAQVEAGKVQTKDDAGQEPGFWPETSKGLLGILLWGDFLGLSMWGLGKLKKKAEQEERASMSRSRRSGRSEMRHIARSEDRMAVGQGPQVFPTVTAVDAINRAAREKLAELRKNNEDRPVFIFVDGPTGSGKNYFAGRFFDANPKGTVAMYDTDNLPAIHVEEDDEINFPMGALRRVVDMIWGVHAKRPKDLIIIVGMDGEEFVSRLDPQRAKGAKQKDGREAKPLIPIDFVVHLHVDESTQQANILQRGRPHEIADIDKWIQDNALEFDPLFYDFIVNNNMDQRGIPVTEVGGRAEMRAQEVPIETAGIENAGSASNTASFKLGDTELNLEIKRRVEMDGSVQEIDVKIMTVEGNEVGDVKLENGEISLIVPLQAGEKAVGKNIGLSIARYPGVNGLQMRVTFENGKAIVENLNPDFPVTQIVASRSEMRGGVLESVKDFGRTSERILRAMKEDGYIDSYLSEPGTWRQAVREGGFVVSLISVAAGAAAWTLAGIPMGAAVTALTAVWLSGLFVLHELAHYGMAYFFWARDRSSGIQTEPRFRKIMISLGGLYADGGISLFLSGLSVLTLENTPVMAGFFLIGAIVYAAHCGLSFVVGDYPNALRALAGKEPVIPGSYGAGEEPQKGIFPARSETRELARKLSDFARQIPDHSVADAARWFLIHFAGANDMGQTSEDAILNALEDLKDKQILEIGPGDHVRFHEWLERNKFPNNVFHGIDPYLKPSKAGERYILGEFPSSVPRKWGGQFDAVIGNRVFMEDYLSDPARAMSALRRILKPGGRIYVSDADQAYLNALGENFTDITSIARKGAPEAGSQKVFSYTRSETRGISEKTLAARLAREAEKIRVASTPSLSEKDVRAMNNDEFGKAFRAVFAAEDNVVPIMDPAILEDTETDGEGFLKKFAAAIVVHAPEEESDLIGHYVSHTKTFPMVRNFFKPPEKYDKKLATYNVLLKEFARRWQEGRIRSEARELPVLDKVERLKEIADTAPVVNYGEFFGSLGAAENVFRGVNAEGLSDALALKAVRTKPDSRESARWGDYRTAILYGGHLEKEMYPSEKFPTYAVLFELEKDLAERVHGATSDGRGIPNVPLENLHRAWVVKIEDRESFRNGQVYLREVVIPGMAPARTGGERSETPVPPEDVLAQLELGRTDAALDRIVNAAWRRTGGGADVEVYQSDTIPGIVLKVVPAEATVNGTLTVNSADDAREVRDAYSAELPAAFQGRVAESHVLDLSPEQTVRLQDSLKIKLISGESFVIVQKAYPVLPETVPENFDWTAYFDFLDLIYENGFRYDDVLKPSDFGYPEGQPGGLVLLDRRGLQKGRWNVAAMRKMLNELRNRTLKFDSPAAQQIFWERSADFIGKLMKNQRVAPETGRSELRIGGLTDETDRRQQTADSSSQPEKRSEVSKRGETPRIALKLYEMMDPGAVADTLRKNGGNTEAVREELEKKGRAELEKMRAEFGARSSEFMKRAEGREDLTAFVVSSDLEQDLSSTFPGFDISGLAQGIRNAVLPSAFAAMEMVDPVVAKIIPEQLQALNATLDNVKGNLTVALDLSLQDGEGFIGQFLEIPSEKTSSVNEMAVIGPLAGDKRGELRARGITVRPAQLNRNFIPVNDQRSVPCVTGSSAAVQTAAAVFDPVMGDLSAVGDPLVRDYMHRLMVVAAIHLADIRTGTGTAGLVSPADIQDELLRRLNLFEQKALIQARGRGFVVSGAAVQAYLQMKARESIEQAA